ncbi:tRNA lysidine(34) synthetase TilS [Bradyrhizobium sp. WD16]|uniref:tRNA lysidine(34) synthetase TilS n=1 Tax=Bradyrhizobium sp. WD16 TaxID=1521768 RepID=UPI0020A26729|nr:tRNA lysidine(34) synthetase TilS [Bradyrhizobium sp. WD16]UTD27280.1 tRNA lysidine(34) synthetase TilS [Bradyrhizobium sp. WD16]
MRRQSGEGQSRAGDEDAPVSPAEADLLFGGFRDLPALVLAVSGGPDSVALLWLAARWRAARERGPRLIAVTVDHGLRPEAVAEARAVRRLAKSLGVEHHVLRWRGAKPAQGIPAAARSARYALLARLARQFGSVHVVTAHTRDDQAETVLMRLLRGSGIAGLSAMAPHSIRDGFVLARPFLDVPKSRLLATLDVAGIGYAVDPTNFDLTFTRARLRALLPVLAREGGDARNLARLAGRLSRAHLALEQVTDAAERACVAVDDAARRSFIDVATFFAAPGEIRLRLLIRAINRAGDEGPAELAKAEQLLAALEQAWARPPARVKQTLAGAVVSLGTKGVSVAPAPPRRAPRSAVPENEL